MQLHGRVLAKCVHGLEFNLGPQEAKQCSEAAEAERQCSQEGVLAFEGSLWASPSHSMLSIAAEPMKMHEADLGSKLRS